LLIAKQADLAMEETLEKFMLMQTDMVFLKKLVKLILLRIQITSHVQTSKNV
jgi:hypothetical protein